MNMMDFIDPQLLGGESHFAPSPIQFEQAEFSFADYMHTDTDDAMGQYSPYTTYQTYPSSPLVGMNPHFLQPDPQPGFGLGYFLDTQLPMEPTFTPAPTMYFPHRGYVNAATQTPSPHRQGASQSNSPSTPKTEAPGGRYSLRRQAARNSKTQKRDVKPAERKIEKREKPKYKRRAAPDTRSLFQPVELKKPLSELAPDIPNFRPLDLETFVRRPADDRIIRGRIIRPLNVFMLYRKTYGKAAQALFPLKQNTQISRIVGVSWKMEPKVVQDRFQELADVERECHFQMFPNYKFLTYDRAEYPLPRTQSANGITEESSEEDDADADPDYEDTIVVRSY